MFKFRNFWLLQLTMIFIFLLYACENTSIEEDNQTENVINSKIEADESVDLPSIEHEEPLLIDNVEEELTKMEEKIVQAYGEQWDFCYCIKKNDSINKAIEADELSDSDLNFLLDRMTEVDEHCKKMLLAPQNSPEERTLYQNKVENCLLQ